MLHKNAHPDTDFPPFPHFFLRSPQNHFSLHRITRNYTELHETSLKIPKNPCVNLCNPVYFCANLCDEYRYGQFINPKKWVCHFDCDIHARVTCQTRKRNMLRKRKLKTKPQGCLVSTPVCPGSPNGRSWGSAQNRVEGRLKEG